MKTVMESLEGRLIESREISRYMIGLTIFLGLLGTFWGLLETINSVSITVKGLDFSENTQKLFQVLNKVLNNHSVEWAQHLVLLCLDWWFTNFRFSRFTIKSSSK